MHGTTIKTWITVAIPGVITKKWATQTDCLNNLTGLAWK